jgi:energy-coupling factor transporter ATP-binding protein EcfA2
VTTYDADVVNDRPVVRLVALGSSIVVRCPDVPTAELVEAEWGWCLAPAGAGEAPDAELDLGGLSPADNGARWDTHPVTAEVTTTAVVRLRGEALVLHACGLANDRGEVVALVGSSGSGKTTAAATLGRHGFHYVTDEAVAVQPEGAVIAFPKPLSIIDPATLAKRQHSPADLGLSRPPADLTIRGVVLLDRQPDAAAASLERLDLVDGMTELFPHAPGLMGFARPLSVLSGILGLTGGVHRLTYPDVTAIGDLLETVLEAVDEDVVSVPADASFDPDDKRWALLDGQVRRRPVIDVIESADKAVVLVGDTPVTLAGLGLTVWRAAAEPVSIAELVHRVVAAHGDHPHARELVTATVDEMVEAKVLGWGYPRPARDVWPGTAPSIQDDTHPQVTCG